MKERTFFGAISFWNFVSQNHSSKLSYRLLPYWSLTLPLDTLVWVILPLPTASSRLNEREHLWTVFLARSGVLPYLTIQQFHQRSDLVLDVQRWSDRGITDNQNNDFLIVQECDKLWWSWTLDRHGKVHTHTDLELRLPLPCLSLIALSQLLVSTRRVK